MFKKLLFLMLFSILTFFNLFSITCADDALDQVYENSKDYQMITTKVNDTHVESWTQKTMKTMLKIAIMVWVAVFLYGGIRFVMSMWDDSKAKKTRDLLITSGLGLIIAFWAWAILQVILSVWYTIQTNV